MPPAPPDAFAPMVEELPAQMEISGEVFKTIGGGCWIFKVSVAEQPFISVTVTVYVPKHNPLTAEVVCPPGCHE